MINIALEPLACLVVALYTFLCALPKRFVGTGFQVSKLTISFVTETTCVLEEESMQWGQLQRNMLGDICTDGIILYCLLEYSSGQY